jgi:diaminopimelate epimerase
MPEQYYWVHKRFKTRPQGEKSRIDFIFEHVPQPRSRGDLRPAARGEDHRRRRPLAESRPARLPHRPRPAGLRLPRHPVRPKVESVLGEKAYASLRRVPEKIDLVDVFRSPEHVGPIVDECLRLGRPRLWLQDGVVNEEAAAKAPRRRHDGGDGPLHLARLSLPPVSRLRRWSVRRGGRRGAMKLHQDARPRQRLRRARCRQPGHRHDAGAGALPCRPPLRRRLRPDPVVEKSARPDADFRYRIFNADGGEVEQCGNGARCFVRFVHEKGLTAKTRHPRRDEGRPDRAAPGDDGLVTVDMGVPRFEPSHVPFVAESDALVQPLHVGGQTVRSPPCRWATRTRCRWWRRRQGAGRRTGPADREPSALSAAGECRLHAGGRPPRDPPARLRARRRRDAGLRHRRLRRRRAGIARGLLDSPVRWRRAAASWPSAWAGRGQPVLMTGPAVTVFDSEIEIKRGMIGQE